MGQTEVGKYIIIVGIILLIIGVIYYFFGHLFSWLGHLPGDIRYENGGTKVFFPITTCIVITVVLNVVIYLVKKFL